MNGALQSIERLETQKALFAQRLADRLAAVPGVLSVTFVGSFVEKPGFEGISDIDVVVVIDALSPSLFGACRSAVDALCVGDHGLPASRMVVNDTFGPLKFDAPGQGVVHLMVYDLEGHRRHVLNSPFTCLDWERSPVCAGPSLQVIYPVLALQPRHFFEARRSLANYLEDLATGCISYRRYDFSDGTCREVTERKTLDERHSGEYAYHIVRYMVANYAKMILQANVRLAPDELRDFWAEWLPGSFSLFPWFTEIERRKVRRDIEYPPDTVRKTCEFLACFEKDLRDAWMHQGLRLRVVRHAATALNDGSFLGQRRDPPVRSLPAALKAAPAVAYSSPARRCLETTSALAPTAKVLVDPDLAEIDYGEAEGLRFSELVERYPELVDGWKRGLDPVFPGGENTAAVSGRVEGFLARIQEHDCLVVTHNVVLRCMLGRRLEIEPRDWHRIPVPHAEPLGLVKLRGRVYLDLSREQMAAIADLFGVPGGAR